MIPVAPPSNITVSVDIAIFFHQFLVIDGRIAILTQILSFLSCILLSAATGWGRFRSDSCLRFAYYNPVVFSICFTSSTPTYLIFSIPWKFFLYLLHLIIQSLIITYHGTHEATPPSYHDTKEHVLPFGTLLQQPSNSCLRYHQGRRA